MLLRVTNKGDARTVDFLGVFAAGETREFNQVEMESFQALSGVPIASSVLTNEDEFGIEFVGENKEG